VKLAKLIFADIYRDGGSYEASFETDEGLIYNVWLQCSRMPDDEGLHHRWLFHYFGDERPKDCLPVVTGSDEERALMGRLRSVLAAPTLEGVSVGTLENKDLDRLNELLGYIERREPCFPFDLARQEFS
jgi:hypothetical protein